MRWILVGAAAVLFALSGCLEPLSRGGSGAETENALYGRLVDKDGQPAIGATIVAIRTGDIQLEKRAASQAEGRVAEDSMTVAGEEGIYAFKNLPPGRYDLKGDYQSGAQVVLVRGVYYFRAGSTLDVGVDTLSAPGSISATVVIDRAEREGIICAIPGTSYLAITDAAGECLLSNVPRGQYTVTYRFPGYLTSRDSAVPVVPGRATVLPAKTLDVDPAGPPPTPTGLIAVLDTFSGAVTVRFNALTLPDLEGYSVYRRDSATEYKEIAFLMGDTTFTDSLFSRYFLANESRTAKLLYSVKARDDQGNQSILFADPATLRVEGPAPFRTLISAEVLDDGSDTTLSPPPAPVPIRLTVSNARAAIRSVSWSEGSSSAFQSLQPLSGDLHSLSQTVSLSASAKTVRGFWVHVTLANGKESKVGFRVLPRHPALLKPADSLTFFSAVLPEGAGPVYLNQPFRVAVEYFNPFRPLQHIEWRSPIPPFAEGRKSLPGFAGTDTLILRMSNSDSTTASMVITAVDSLGGRSPVTIGLQLQSPLAVRLLPAGAPVHPDEPFQVEVAYDNPWAGIERLKWYLGKDRELGQISLSGTTTKDTLLVTLGDVSPGPNSLKFLTVDELGGNSVVWLPILIQNR